MMNNSKMSQIAEDIEDYVSSSEEVLESFKKHMKKFTKKKNKKWAKSLPISSHNYPSLSEEDDCYSDIEESCDNTKELLSLILKNINDIDNNFVQKCFDYIEDDVTESSAQNYLVLLSKITHYINSNKYLKKGDKLLYLDIVKKLIEKMCDIECSRKKILDLEQTIKSYNYRLEQLENNSKNKWCIIM